MPTEQLSDKIDIPKKNTFNIGLHSGKESTMKKKLGLPGQLTKNCSKPDKAFQQAHLSMDVNFGPFVENGLKEAVASLKRVLAAAKAINPELVKQLKTEGMLCVRHKRKNAKSYSNHSWGTAIDLFYGAKVVPQGVKKTHRGVLALVPFFNAEGWYWGGGFSGEFVDSMHFELAEETITKL